MRGGLYVVMGVSEHSADWDLNGNRSKESCTVFYGPVLGKIPDKHLVGYVND